MKTALVAALGIILILFATSARAENWFLMAPSEKAIKNRMLVHQLGTEKKSAISLVSHGRFSSRYDCEIARATLIQEWRKDGSLSTQEFSQYGGVDLFFVCVTESDPHVVKSASGGPPTMVLPAFFY
jgi:hypothetical protein